MGYVVGLVVAGVVLCLLGAAGVLAVPGGDRETRAPPAERAPAGLAGSAHAGASPSGPGLGP